MKKNIVIGVTGSIAAYKTVNVIKQLKNQLPIDVHVIMTDHATRLVDPKEFEKSSGNPVQSHLFLPHFDYRKYLADNTVMEHISLADTANLFLVCPSSANTIAKVAYGIADDLLTASILATNAPVIFCPAMNVKMWQNPITQENVKKLKHVGYYIVDPEYGELACGYRGVGRLAHSDQIVYCVKSILTKHTQLQDKKVIVTAGATSEPIDGVRVLSNRASGKMGASLANEAYMRGANTVLIRNSTAAASSYPYKETIIESRQDILTAIKTETGKEQAIVFHTAAVTDFALAIPMLGKTTSDHALDLKLLPSPKILDQIKRINPKTYVVGFKAEYNVSRLTLINRAYETLVRSRADLVVANDVGKAKRGFGVDTNEVYIVDKEKQVKHLPLATKRQIAGKILDYVAEMSS